MSRYVIYARKSTKQKGEKDERSAEQQVAVGRQKMQARGFTPAEPESYTDDEISGAAFGLARPGLGRLLDDARRRPRPFDVVFVTVLDRFGRKMGPTLRGMELLAEAGVTLFDDAGEIPLGTATERLMACLKVFPGEAFLESVVKHTRRALSTRHANGWSAGGKIYGYTTEAVGEHAEFRRVDEEAAIVIRIFEYAAAGKGLRRIARALADDAVPAPRGHGWGASVLRGILRNELYRGVYVWGRTRNETRTDAHGNTRKVKVPVPVDDWQRTAVPTLRIVPDPLWRAAHARLDQTRAAYIRNADGTVHGRPESGLESKYLLSGFCQCAGCGGSMYAKRTPSGDIRYYCFKRREGRCANGAGFLLEAGDTAVLAALHDDILNPEALALAIEQAATAYTSAEDLNATRATLAAEAARLDSEVMRLVDALATGSEAVAKGLKERERRLADVRARLDDLDGQARRPRLDKAQVMDELRRRLGDWQALLKAEPPKARQILRKLVTGRIVFTPGPNGYTFDGVATYGRLLTGLVDGGGHAWSNRATPVRAPTSTTPPSRS